jgi:hypothetical protein
MVNIILQHFDGELRELDKLSMANIQEYAKLVNADYKLITGKPFRKHLTSPCQKVHMLHEEFDDYDDVLMLDIDMFAPKNMTTNIFEESGIGLYEEVQHRLHHRLAASYPMYASLLYPYWGGAIYKFSKDMRVKLRSELGGNEAWMHPYNKLYNYEDEGIIHTLAVKSGFTPKKPYLHRRWCQCSFLPSPKTAGFIHVRTKITPQGPKREKIENYQALVDKGIL